MSDPDYVRSIQKLQSLHCSLVILVMEFHNNRKYAMVLTLVSTQLSSKDCHHCAVDLTCRLHELLAHAQKLP